jgi:hypothetical protein
MSALSPIQISLISIIISTFSLFIAALALRLNYMKYKYDTSLAKLQQEKYLPAMLELKTKLEKQVYYVLINGKGEIEKMNRELKIEKEDNEITFFGIDFTYNQIMSPFFMIKNWKLMRIDNVYFQNHFVDEFEFINTPLKDNLPFNLKEMLYKFKYRNIKKIITFSELNNDDNEFVGIGNPFDDESNFKNYIKIDNFQSAEEFFKHIRKIYILVDRWFKKNGLRESSFEKTIDNYENL